MCFALGAGAPHTFETFDFSLRNQLTRFRIAVCLRPLSDTFQLSLSSLPTPTLIQIRRNHLFPQQVRMRTTIKLCIVAISFSIIESLKTPRSELYLSMYSPVFRWTFLCRVMYLASRCLRCDVLFSSLCSAVCRSVCCIRFHTDPRR